MINNKISRTLTSLFICLMTGAVLIPAFAVNADTKIEISEKVFPDDNFRTYVSDHLDDNHDGKLSSDEIKGIRVIGCDECGIKDLSGIELFTELEELYIYKNELTKVDLSKNTKLCILSCGDNPFETLDLANNTKLKKLLLANGKLKTIDLSKNTDIVYLDLSDNNLEKLDLSKNTKLKELYINNNKIDEFDIYSKPDLLQLECSNSAITSLKLEQCPNLGLLTCSNNAITSLDLEHCPKLWSLDCSKNAITSLNIESCPELTNLDCSNNKLTSFDMSANTKLISLECSNNKLTSLDISANPKLTELECSNNKLTSLNISANPELYLLYCQGNQIDRLNISCCEHLLEAFAGNKSNEKGYVYYTNADFDDDLGGYELAVDDKTIVISNLFDVDDRTKQIYLDLGAVVSLGFEGADDKTQVTLTSSDDSVVKLGDNNSLITKKAGSSDITAKVGDKEYKFKVTVYYKDVKDKTKFWFEPTYALTEKGVVKGYDNQTQFKAANKCTRAQMVTFIWRLAGSPEPVTKECKFSDVKKSDYFYKACLWGNENHIVEGYKDGTFGPQIVCARRHAVTFLWRLAGKPEPAGDKTKFAAVFKDIDEDDYFFEATIWATEKKIVAGYDDNTFRPDGDCLRRQMVTFLYKYDKFVINK